MIKRKGLEIGRHLGGDTMLRILLCDDDIDIIDTMRSVTEATLKELKLKAKIFTYTDASSISDQILSSCDIALLDIDFDRVEYNGIESPPIH